MRQRIAISGRPALEHVQDVNVLALQPARFNDLVEQLPAAADERLAQSIFVGTGRFAQKAQPRFRVADAEHGLRSRARQLVATRAAGDFLLQYFQRQSAGAALGVASRRFKKRRRRRSTATLDFFVIGASICACNVRSRVAPTALPLRLSSPSQRPGASGNASSCRSRQALTSTRHLGIWSTPAC